MKIIYIDFDGVINSYKTKFDQSNPGSLPDPPVPGAIEFLSQAVKRFKVVIFTCRMLQPEQEALIHAWLFKHGMANNLIDQLSFSCVKRGATCYIDDRAVPFSGTFPSLDYLETFKPWQQNEFENN